MSGWPSGLRRQTQGFAFFLDKEVVDYGEFWSSDEGVGSNPTSDKILKYCLFLGNCDIFRDTNDV